MAQAAAKLRQKFAPIRVDKFAERRAALADAAVEILAELGYARTSLREIAQKAEFSHGVLHYYFSDKVDLITCCVRQYKQRCVTRYDQVTAEAATATALLDGFADALAATLRDDASHHRLWYDLRAQALFEPAFQADVIEIDRSLEAMIGRITARLYALADVAPRWDAALLYPMIDGLFQQALLRHLAGEAAAASGMAASVRRLLRGITS